MRGREGGRPGTAACAALLLLCACGGAPKRAPDVVLVVVDTLRADATGIGGNPFAATPALDALAAESAWFSRAYACSSWTLSSTATLLTGLYPWQHRAIRDPDDASRFGRLAPDLSSLAERLRARGYRTGAWVNNLFLAPEFGLQAGFDVYDWEGAARVGHRTASATVDAALAWLGASEMPAFLFVHLMEPHLDYDPGPEYRGRFSKGAPHTVPIPIGRELQLRWMERRETPSVRDQTYLRLVYYEEALAADAAIGRLVEALRRRPGWAETRLVVTSDHGEEFWDTGGFEHGHNFRSAVTHVPLVVRLPGARSGEHSGVVDHAGVFELLLAGSGSLAERARSAEAQSGGVALHDDLFHGRPQLGIVDATHRLELGPGDEVRLWQLQGGHESRELEPDDPHAEALRRRLVERRGSLEPAAPHEPATIRSVETFRRLRELGYVE